MCHYCCHFYYKLLVPIWEIVVISDKDSSLPKEIENDIIWIKGS